MASLSQQGAQQRVCVCVCVCVCGSRADLKGESGHSAHKLPLQHSDETFSYGFVTMTNLYSFEIILILRIFFFLRIQFVYRKTNVPPFYLKKLCTSAFKGIFHPKMKMW